MDGLQLDAFENEGSPERAATSPDSGHAAQLPDTSKRATAEPEDDFRWWFRDENEAAIVVQEQLAIAVYRNRANGIVIRQQSTESTDDDGFVVLRDIEAAKALIAALQREIGVKVR